MLHGGITTSYTYPGTSHRLSNVGGVSRGYDAVGNTTSIGGTAREFVYNANDRMSQVKQTGAVTMGYRYNARGERVAAINGDTGPISTHSLYDEAGQWIGDYDSGGTAIQQAIWMDDAPVGLLVGAGTVQALKYIQTDHLGTPRAVIDPIRNVAIWTWDAKGEAFGNSPPNQDADQDGTAFVFDMRFPGQRYDAATGLNYNYFRDYDTSTGRYVQGDPLGTIGGPSIYGYANSTPLLRIDAQGLIASCKCTDAGIEIEIPIEFNGSSASPELVATRINAIETTWSSPGFTVTVTQGKYPNKIEVAPGNGVSTVTGHDKGTWYADSDPWVAAHEAGHLMKFKYDGRHDMYDITSTNPRRSQSVPGWEGTIMAEYPGVVDQRTRDAIIQTLKCKKKGIFGWLKRNK